MAAEFQLEIITPNGTFYSKKVTSLVAPQMDGYFGVLAFHAPLLARSAGGTLTVHESGTSTKQFRIGPGAVEVLKNRAVILSKQAATLSP